MPCEDSPQSPFFSVKTTLIALFPTSHKAPSESYCKKMCAHSHEQTHHLTWILLRNWSYETKFISEPEWKSRVVCHFPHRQSLFWVGLLACPIRGWGSRHPLPLRWISGPLFEPGQPPIVTIVGTPFLAQSPEKGCAWNSEPGRGMCWLLTLRNHRPGCLPKASNSFSAFFSRPPKWSTMRFAPQRHQDLFFDSLLSFLLI